MFFFWIKKTKIKAVRNLRKSAKSAGNKNKTRLVEMVIKLVNGILLNNICSFS